MQGMSNAICENAPIGATGQLYDTRDGSTYTIAKLDDGNCWMTQNLRLVGKTITSDNSDLTSANSPYTVPSSSSPWASSDTSRQNVHYASNTTNGAYYSWCAATAGTCSSATTDGINAPSSICPKRWKLPTWQEYKDLVTAMGIRDNSDGATKIMGNPYNFVMGGYIWSSKLDTVGSSGWYWSSTASSSAEAYYLFLGSNSVNTRNGNRYYGFSIRCIAK